MVTQNISDDLKASALAYHRGPKPGKLAITATKPLATQHDLALAYTPGVAVACEAIAADPRISLCDRPDCFSCRGTKWFNLSDMVRYWGARGLRKGLRLLGRAA